MKKVYSFILITVFSASVFGQTVPSYVPTNGLVGWWPFNGNANDESGNGHNGTVNGATLTTDRFGNANKAYSFDGIDDNIIIDSLNVSTINNGKNTVSFWMYWYGQTEQIPFCWDTGYSLYFKNGQFGINTYQGNTLGIPSNNIDSAWVNVVAVFPNNVPDTSNSELWINGIKQSIQGWATASKTADKKVFIGSGYDGGYRFSSKLDDIGIWNRALTQAEITTLYTANGVGIKDQSLNQLSIYPNPAKTQITLNTTTNQIGKTLKVYDALGKVVYETILKQQQYNINITNWANGIYTVAIPEQGLTYKFVKE
jgi:hypothetical protein